MVRRLIQDFLHWLQHILAQVRGSNDNHQPPAPQQRLPPSQQHREAPDSQESSHSVPTPIPSYEQPNEQLDTESSTSEQPVQPTNPTSAKEAREASESNFQVLLSDYQYSPNPAIQDLSHQLSQPPPQTEAQPTAAPSKSQPDFSDIDLPASETRLPTKPGPLPTFPASKQESLPTEQSATSIIDGISHISDANSAETNIAPLRSTSTLSETPGTDSKSITKQGVVKLLFKLKQSNHHGYIEPKDGSKDIIFHQKYIGHEIFGQLERGMEVEVTAHITAGKAYADHIRIL
ncbi:cold shock domain-containing protein [Leptolyngbya cf. ectocarpi LEGE 11479]|uniref:Cold shock domain-containing protein n=1 Tax=Leptolyngbya cf. ectocarpi LEGE 11479 TaxID=1828722 RepID=A0A928X0U6_LEPEC|nr:cold shock domain-containing protein [Leptolyngbya ectocarpi]MBE9066362.1 cold shock domain-containing protein [Leptolyngbya cf. ectocarpi LEGE 11479]